jgi:uncharacterized membrane protein YdbT with pleckstrin-like domain
VRVDVRPHPVALVRAGLSRLFQAALLLIAVRLAGSDWLDWVLTSTPFVNELGPGGGPLPIASWVWQVARLLLLLVLALAALDLARWRSTRYLLTDQRLLHVVGFLGSASLETPLDRIDEVVLGRSWLGEQLDYGYLAIRRASGDDANRFPFLPGPAEFKRTLQATRTAWLKAQGTGRGASRPDPQETARALREMARLRDEGVLSAAEMDEKKAELLRRM